MSAAISTPEGITNPPIDELLDRTQSKYALVIIAAKRARQLQSGARALVQTPTKKVTKVAQMEVEAGLVPIEVLELANNSDKTKKSGASK